MENKFRPAVGQKFVGIYEGNFYQGMTSRHIDGSLRFKFAPCDEGYEDGIELSNLIYWLDEDCFFEKIKDLIESNTKVTAWNISLFRALFERIGKTYTERNNRIDVAEYNASFNNIDGVAYFGFDNSNDAITAIGIEDEYSQMSIKNLTDSEDEFNQTIKQLEEKRKESLFQTELYRYQQYLDLKERYKDVDINKPLQGQI